jgi:hypothetical protein
LIVSRRDFDFIHKSWTIYGERARIWRSELETLEDSNCRILDNGCGMEELHVGNEKMRRQDNAMYIGRHINAYDVCG